MHICDNLYTSHDTVQVNGSGGKVSSEANNKFADEDDAPPPPPGPPSTPPPLYTPPDTYSKVLATGVTKAGLSWSKVRGLSGL